MRDTTPGADAVATIEAEPVAGPAAEPAAEPVWDVDLDAYRRDLLGYCYRMMASPSEAEDAVQETLLRAWRARGGFEQRSSVRTWLYRIAHHVCADMQRSPQRRARPMELGGSRPFDGDMGEPLPAGRFVEPIADDRVLDLTGDPAEVAAARETVRLAFLAALQHLSARQRSALILCEVLRWSAVEVAELFETTVPAVNSALQRARTLLREHQGERLDPVTDQGHRDLLDRYARLFERYDIPGLVALMRADVVLSMPPYPMWLRGPDQLAGWFLGRGIVCRDSRLVPVDVNGTAGFGTYHRVSDGRWEPFAVQVVEAAGGRIVAQHNFLYPERFTDFGLPAAVERP